MTLGPISAPILPMPGADRAKVTTLEHNAGKPASSFEERLNNAIDKVAEAQRQAANAAKDYELGKNQNLAGVMVDQQVASLGFQLTLQVRNKALSAYKDIMNMPV